MSVLLNRKLDLQTHSPWLELQIVFCACHEDKLSHIKGQVQIFVAEQNGLFKKINLNPNLSFSLYSLCSCCTDRIMCMIKCRLCFG